MNVKIGRQAIRFRVSSEECDLLISEGGLAEKFDLGGVGFSVIIEVCAHLEEMLFLMEEGEVKLFVPLGKVEKLRKMGRSRKGIVAQQGAVEVFLQVNLRTI